ncbi:MAG: hypothetical protein C1O27_002024 [Chloroflexi bacterium]|jgi:hypothetical protein|nr:MAG: hypothetical protein C1O27_002024 [Chloroflexota bacterium]
MCHIAGGISLNPALLRWPASIVRDWGDVNYAGHMQTGRLKGPNGGLAACPSALDEHLNLMQSVFHRFASCGLCRALASKSRALAGALEAYGA